MKFNDYLEGLKRTPQYWEAAAREEFASVILPEIAQQGKDYEELGATRPEIKRALKGLAVIFKIAFALGYRVRISLEKIEEGKE